MEYKYNYSTRRKCMLITTISHGNKKAENIKICKLLISLNSHLSEYQTINLPYY